MKFFRSAGIFAGILAVSIGVAACDFSGVSDSIDDFQLVIGLEPINTVVAGQLLDAKTGELVEQEVTLTFTGEDAGSVIDLYSDPMSEQQVEGGLTSFGIDNAATPTSSDPVTFTVTAEADGYLAASKKVSVREEAEGEFLIYMTNENQPPDGAAATQQSAGEAGSDGQVTSSFSVETPEENVSGGSASMTVEQGTVAEDPDGQTLSGQLTTQMTYFTGQSGSALRSFPGGAGSGPGGQSLSTGGFASITVQDPSGRTGTSFSKDLALSLRVPEGTINPETGQPIADGETIGIYSYDAGASEWVEEGQAEIVGPPSNGTYRVDFTSNHLSYFSVGYGQDSCAEGATITVDRNGNQGSLTVVVEGTSGGFSETFTLPAGDSEFTLADVPASGVEVTVTGSAGSASVTLSDACSGSGSMTLPAPSAPMIDVDFTLVPTCPGPDEAVRVSSVPSAVVYYRLASKSTGTWNRAGTVSWTFDDEESALEKGELTVSGLIDGEVYTFKTTYDGETYQKEVTISGSSKTINEDVDDEYCD